MKIPACFGNPNSTHQISSHKSSTTDQNQMPQNLITSTYQTQLCNSPTQLTLTWSKSLFSHSLTLYPSDNSFSSITIYLYPSSTFFFRTWPGLAGSKSINLTTSHHKIKLYWDFSRAAFLPHNSAEPDSSFYIAITFNSRLEFFLGDLPDELTRRAGCSSTLPAEYSRSNILLSRREHVFGRRTYITRAQFMSRSKHDEIEIDCGGGVLKVKVNGVTSLVVKRLAWKFRGNERIKISSGVEVEFYWDVFNWVSTGNSKSGIGHHGVFVFQIGDGGGGGIWPEMVGPEKKLMRKSFSEAAAAGRTPPSPSCSSSVLQWAEESSTDQGGRRSSSSSSSTKSCGSNGAGAGGFSLLLYAWRK